MPSVQTQTYKNESYADKNNPNFKGKKHNLVIDAQGASNREVQTESGTLRFENGVAVLPPDTRAEDIVAEMNEGSDLVGDNQALHPNQFALIKGRENINMDSVHRYHFGSQPGLPGHAARGIRCMNRFCEECNPELIERDKDSEVNDEQSGSKHVRASGR